MNRLIVKTLRLGLMSTLVDDPRHQSGQYCQRGTDQLVSFGILLVRLGTVLEPWRPVRSTQRLLMVCVLAGREFECNFGFVGADKEGGRVCVPYKEGGKCGGDGRDACTGAPRATARGHAFAMELCGLFESGSFPVLVIFLDEAMHVWARQTHSSVQGA